MSKLALWMTRARIADEVQEFLGDGREDRLVLQESRGQAMHRFGLRRHVALGIDVDVEGPARRRGG